MDARRCVALALMALANARGSNGPRCSANACMACLQRCWDGRSDSPALVRDLSDVLPSTTAGAGALGVCSSAVDTAKFLRAARAVVHAHRSAIGIDKVWGLGLHGSSGHFWVAWYACVRSSVNRGQCQRASLAVDHGFFLVECPGRRVCKLDTAQIDSRDLTQLVSACLHRAASGQQPSTPSARRWLMDGAAAHAATTAVPPPTNASAPGKSTSGSGTLQLRAALGRRLNGAAGTFGTAPARQRQWDCAARALAARPLAGRAEGGWIVYPQRSTRRSTYARYRPSKLVAFSDSSDEAGETGRTGSARTTLVPVTTYAVADLLQDGCFGARQRSAPCHALCSPCKAQPSLLHRDACANLTAHALPAGPTPQASAAAARGPSAALRAARLALRAHWPAEIVLTLSSANSRLSSNLPGR